MPGKVTNTGAVSQREGGRHSAMLAEFLRKRALELIALPADERNGHYDTIHATGLRLAMSYGKPEGEASAWALKIVLLTRLMVRILEKDRSAFSRPAVSEGHGGDAARRAA